jgi:hypothetical protein
MLHAHWIYLDIPETEEAFRHMARFFSKHLGRGAQRGLRSLARSTRSTASPI